MRKKILIHFLGIFLIPALSYTQIRELDSLKKIVKFSEEDTLKIKAAIKIGEKTENSNTDTAMFYYNYALMTCNQMLKTQKTKLVLNRLISLKAKTLIHMGIIYKKRSNYSESLLLTKESLELFESIDYKEGISLALNNIANTYDNLGQISDAVKYHIRSLKISEERGNKKGIATSYGNLALIYKNQGQIPNALDYNSRALKIREETGDKEGIGISLSNLAVIYQMQGQISEALDYYYRSLKISEEIGDKEGLSITYHNIANIYLDQGRFEQALDYYDRSLKIMQEIDYKLGIAATLSNMAEIYQNQGQITQAIDCITQSLKISELIGSKEITASSLNALAIIKLKQHEDNLAYKYAAKALELSKEIGYPERIKDASNTLYEINLKQKNFPAALEMYKLYVLMRDSIKNEENQQNSLKSKMQYDFEKTTALQKVAFEKSQDSIKLVTERKIALQALDYEYAQKQAQAKSEAERKQLVFEEELKRNQIESNFKQKQAALHQEQKRKEVIAKAEQDKKDALSEKQKEKQRLILIFVLAGLLLVTMFALFVYNRYKITQGQKQIIEIKEKETQEQKQIIEEKQKEIVDSINYAKLIQNTLFANQQLLKNNLKEHFVYFSPKDIVSGDFYWATKQNNKFYIAVCDSTGHGVPGAFMSLLNIGFLAQAINEKGIEKPNEVFDFVRMKLTDTISKEGQKDGFDGILVCFDSETKQITYAAANNTPLLISKKQDNVELDVPAYNIVQLPTDRMPVGIGERKQSFSLHTINCKPGDLLYLYTDGYPDQFGGPKGKKFMYKQLNELLLANHPKKIHEQKTELENAFNNWKGNLEQIDDVCVIGIRI